MTATGAALACSARVIVLPKAGVAPSSSKNPGETYWPSISSGSGSPESVNFQSGETAAMPRKDRDAADHSRNSSKEAG